jgi:hypothetical protein
MENSQGSSAMLDDAGLTELERQLADAHARIREIDRRDELIADLQRRMIVLPASFVPSMITLI